MTPAKTCFFAFKFVILLWTGSIHFNFRIFNFLFYHRVPNLGHDTRPGVLKPIGPFISPTSLCRDFSDRCSLIPLWFSKSRVLYTYFYNRDSSRILDDFLMDGQVFSSFGGSFQNLARFLWILSRFFRLDQYFSVWGKIFRSLARSRAAKYFLISAGFSGIWSVFQEPAKICSVALPTLMVLWSIQSVVAYWYTILVDLWVHSPLIKLQKIE